MLMVGEAEEAVEAAVEAGEIMEIATGVLKGATTSQGGRVGFKWIVGTIIIGITEMVVTIEVAEEVTWVAVLL